MPGTVPDRRPHRRVPVRRLALAAAFVLAACGGDAPPAATPAELDRVWRGAGPAIEVRVHELECTGCEAFHQQGSPRRTMDIARH